MLREIVDRAFLGPQVRGAESGRQAAVYPNGGGGWHWESLIWSDDPDQNYELMSAHAEKKVAPANSKLDRVLGHREFRVKVLAIAPVVWGVVGVLSTLAR